MYGHVSAPHDTTMASTGQVNPDGSPVKAAKTVKGKKLATDPQRMWIGKVLGNPDTIMTAAQRSFAEAALADPQLTSKDAGIVLDLLFALPKVDHGVPDGLYRDPQGMLYVVRPNKAGTSHYALVLDGKRLEYVKGARDNLTEAMRLGSAEEVPELDGLKNGYVSKTIKAALTA